MRLAAGQKGALSVSPSGGIGRFPFDGSMDGRTPCRGGLRPPKRTADGQTEANP